MAETKRSCASSCPFTSSHVTVDAATVNESSSKPKLARITPIVPSSTTRPFSTSLPANLPANTVLRAPLTSTTAWSSPTFWTTNAKLPIATPGSNPTTRPAFGSILIVSPGSTLNPVTGNSWIWPIYDTTAYVRASSIERSRSHAPSWQSGSPMRYRWVNPSVPHFANFTYAQPGSSLSRSTMTPVWDGSGWSL